MFQAAAVRRRAPRSGGTAGSPLGADGQPRAYAAKQARPEGGRGAHKMHGEATD